MGYEKDGFAFLIDGFELTESNERLYTLRYSPTIVYNSQYFNISVRLFISSMVSCQYFRLCEFVRVGLTQSVRAPDLYTWASLNEFPINKISFAGIANLSLRFLIYSAFSSKSKSVPSILISCSSSLNTNRFALISLKNFASSPKTLSIISLTEPETMYNCIPLS